MLKKILLASVAGLAVAATGVAAFSGGAGAAENARVRVIHASPDAPAVDVYANDGKVLSNVPFKTASDYLSVPAGAYNFKVFATGANPASDTAVIDADAALEAGKDYTVVALGKLADIKPGVFVDNNAAPAAGKAHVRVLHASPDAPAVDIAVKSGPVLFPNLAFEKQAGPSPVDAGTYDLEVRAAGTMTVALAIDDVTLEAGKIYDVLAVGLLNGEPALSALPIVTSPAAAPPPVASPSAVPPVTSPNTGTGDALGGSSAPWLLIGALAAAGVVLAGGGVLATRRTR